MPSAKEKYESFLISNVSTISSLESSLRSLTWFLPGRFKDADLASEALTTLLNVMSMYHDTLLSRVVKSNPTYRPLIPSSLHTRFTRAWTDKSSPYKWAARTLEVIRYTELVIEMALRRKISQKVQWRAIILLEVIKAALRLLILKITRRPLISPLVPEREFDPSALQTDSQTTNPLQPSPATHSSLDPPDHLLNNHTPIDIHPLLSSKSDTSPEDFLASKALNSSSVKPSVTLISKLSGPQDWIAEVTYILRPLVYASLLLTDRSSGRQTNRALVVTLCLEFFSRNLRRTPPSSASLERQEYARRDKDILWYLLRGSIWESYTRPKLEGLIERTSNAPILGLLGGFAKEWIPLLNDYYYYTAP